MDLVRDCLDKQLADRHGRPVGRIDGIVLSIEDGAQPRVVAVEVGSVAQARRLGPRWGRWAERLALRWGKMGGNPCRFAWPALTRHGNQYRLDRNASEVPTLAWERWVRTHVIDRIPGG